MKKTALLDRILGDIRDLFNPWHDPATGRFTYTSASIVPGVIRSQGGQRSTVPAQRMPTIGQAPYDQWGEQVSSEELRQRVLALDTEYGRIHNELAADWKATTALMKQTRLDIERATAAHGANSPEVRLLKESTNVLLERVNWHQDQMRAQMERFDRGNDDALQLLVARNGAAIRTTLGVELPAGSTPEQLKAVVTRVASMTEASVLPTGDSVARVGIGHSTSTASHYSNGTLWMMDRSPASDVAHEMGHWIESNGRMAIQEAAFKFLEARCGKEQSTRPAEYGGDVSLRKDRFLDPYTGRDYVRSDGTRYASEIISTGLGHLFDNAAVFARDDPEHFRFTIDALHGRFK